LNIYSELLPNKLYEKNTKSNGGRLGYYYVVIPVNTVYYPPAEVDKMTDLEMYWEDKATGIIRSIIRKLE